MFDNTHVNKIKKVQYGASTCLPNNIYILSLVNM